MAYEPVIQIWNGSSSFSPGMTPYGYYDSDPIFTSECDKFATWAASRLGYPITDVELIDLNFYNAIEDAVTRYSTLVSTANAKDNLINLSGTPTGSANFTGNYIQPTLAGIFNISKQYATEAGVGGNLTYYTGSITTTPGVQVYDLLESDIEKGDFNLDQFTIRKIFYQRVPESTYINNEFDLMSQFGWSNNTQDIVMMPMNYDMLKLQAVEVSNQIYKSAYSFQLTGNRLRIFPIPSNIKKIHFQYTLNNEFINNLPVSTTGSNSSTNGLISDISNIPYQLITYSQINEIGRDWIRRYGLSICKEMLGLIRGKYNTIPMGDNELTLNYTDLITQAQTEQEGLTTELKELLVDTSRQSQLERKQAESTALQEQLLKVPLKIYIR